MEQRNKVNRRRRPSVLYLFRPVQQSNWENLCRRISFPFDFLKDEYEAAKMHGREKANAQMSPRSLIHVWKPYVAVYVRVCVCVYETHALSST